MRIGRAAPTPARDSAEWFANYATALFKVLGDRVGQWLTINEAKVIAEQGYQYGRMAPGRSDLRASGTPSTTLLTCCNLRPCSGSRAPFE
jgi:beta-glucosidase/6-phospho-beta-glucosidase/beta-galactosidase